MTADYYLYFVYRHIRLDTNEVFYVGRGKAYIRKRRMPRSRSHGYLERYWRAFDKTSRNRFWDNIVRKTKYEVEIIYESDNFNEICEKEKEFIELYGRRDLKLGTLVNINEGGDGNAAVSEESKQMSRKHREESGLNQRMREERSKPICVYDASGNFIKEFENKYECAKFIRCSPHTINSYLYEKKSLNLYLLSRDKNGVDISKYRIFRPHISKIERYNESGILMGIYNGIEDAIEKCGTYSSAIWRSITTNKPVCGYLWKRGVFLTK